MMYKILHFLFVSFSVLVGSGSARSGKTELMVSMKSWTPAHNSTLY